MTLALIVHQSWHLEMPQILDDKKLNGFLCVQEGV
jgi:hypothetical protein